MITADSLQQSIQMGAFPLESFDYSQYIYILLQDVLFEFYYQIIVQLRNFFEFYSLAVDLRILLSWFLNINPYTQPFMTLWKFTDPVMFIGRNIYPRPFGSELNFMINIQILIFMLSELQKQAALLEPVHYQVMERFFNK